MDSVHRLWVGCVCFAVHPLSLTNGVPRQKMCVCVCACLLVYACSVCYLGERKKEKARSLFLTQSNIKNETRSYVAGLHFYNFNIYLFFNIFFLNPLPSYSVASGSNNTFIQAACVASLVHNYGYCYSKGWNHIHYNNHKIYFLCFWQKITLVMSAWMSLKIMLKEFKWFPHQDCDTINWLVGWFSEGSFA